MTNLRLPGQYDERLLGSVGLQGPYYNWNRWYLPGVGRYVELDPVATRGEFNTGNGVDWYSYAGGAPLRNVDPEGLYSKGPGCENYPTEEELVVAALRITDGCLRTCIYGQIDSARLVCDSRKAVSDCQMDYWNQFWGNPRLIGEVDKGGTCRVPHREVIWCSRNMSKRCRIDALLHEFAHGCGWDERQGKGVPGNEGTLAGCSF